MKVNFNNPAIQISIASLVVGVASLIVGVISLMIVLGLSAYLIVGLTSATATACAGALLNSRRRE